jgi:stage II sporulation SpoAA-like protein
MPMTVQHEDGNICRVEIHGTLQKADFDGSQAALAAEIQRLGPVRLLILLSKFEGWSPSAGWNDLSFYVKHGDDIERIAIVGDEKWRSHALMFSAAGLRRAPVEFFPEGALAAARTWLSDPAGSP